MSNWTQTPEAILRRLDWTVIRRLDGMLHGDYRSLFCGFGMELADLREYVYHDDVRLIDWNVTARLQTPYVRVYREERSLSAWFLLDLSPSIDFGSQERSKQHVALELVTVLARLLSRHGNRVGAMFYGSKVDTIIPARSGRLHILSLLRRMMTHANALQPAPTRLTDLLSAASHTISQRALVFVVSDFISHPGWEKPLAQLAQRHEVIVVRIVDPLELAMPDLGLITMQDSETGEQLFVDTHDAKFQRRFAIAAIRREEELRKKFQHAQTDALELATDDDLIDALLRFSTLRSYRRRARAGSTGLARDKARS